MKESPSVPPPAGIKCYSQVRTFPSDVNLQAEQGTSYQVRQLVELTSGEIAVPILRVVEPRFTGVGGGVRAERVWQKLLLPLGTGRSIPLPDGSDIRSHILLLRLIVKPGVVSEDSWRYWKFNPPAIGRNAGNILIFPEYMKLEVLDDVKGGKEFLRKVEDAEAYYNQIAD